MKTLIAVIFGMVLDQFLLWLLYRSVKDKRENMVALRDKDGVTMIDAEEFEIRVPEGYNVTNEGDKIMIRKKKEDKE